jgi:hypothetical protein
MTGTEAANAVNTTIARIIIVSSYPVGSGRPSPSLWQRATGFDSVYVA